MNHDLRDDDVSLLLELGGSLHAFGTPARRLEATLRCVADRMGMEVQVLSTVTCLMISFGPGSSLRTALLRADPQALDLGRLSRLDLLIDRFLRGGLRSSELLAALVSLRTVTILPSLLQTLLGRAVGAASWSLLLGGGPSEAGAAAAAGTMVGALGRVSELRGWLHYEFDVLAAAIVGATVAIWSACSSPLSVHVASLSALLPLLPGLPLVTGMEEIASRDLLAGTSRLMAAAFGFFQIVFGVALGAHVASLLGGSSSEVRHALPLAGQALLLVPALAVLAQQFHVARQDLHWVFLAGLVGYASARIAARALGLELGAFVAALLVGSFGNAVARWQRRPALLTIVPGMFALWPGSLGFQSVSALWSAQPLDGVRSAFSAAMVAVASATGLLASSSILSPKRIL